MNDENKGFSQDGTYRMSKEQVESDNIYTPETGTVNSGNNTKGYQSQDSNGYYTQSSGYQSQNGNGYYTQGSYDSVNVNNGCAGKTKKTKKIKNKKPVTTSRVVGICMAFTMLAVLLNSAGLFLSYSIFSDKYATKKEAAAGNIPSTTDSLATVSGQNSGGYSVAQIVETCMPSVVAITSTSIVQSNANPFYGGGTYQVKGAGSGIIVGKNETELLIATNNHVVEDSTALSILFGNDVSVDKAYVKGTSTSNDLAIVAIPLDDLDEDTLSYIKIATLGDSNKMNVGDGVIAIGNALGYGQSVTVGYISAKDRTISLENGDLNVIQTDAAINGGNSGGALINMNGEVIGINVAKSSSNSSTSASVEGMGYAIPISEAKEVLDKLSNEETRRPVDQDERGYLGVSVVTSDESATQYYNIPQGAYVREVAKGGPAEKAGIKPRDVIVGIDDKEVTNRDELLDIMGTYKAGEKVKVTVMRANGQEYEEIEIEVELVLYDQLS